MQFPHASGGQNPGYGSFQCPEIPHQHQTDSIRPDDLQ